MKIVARFQNDYNPSNETTIPISEMISAARKLRRLACRELRIVRVNTLDL